MMSSHIVVTKSKVPGFIPQCGFLPRLAVTLQKTPCLRLHYSFKGRGFNVVTAAANAHIECPSIMPHEMHLRQFQFLKQDRSRGSREREPEQQRHTGRDRQT